MLVFSSREYLSFPEARSLDNCVNVCLCPSVCVQTNEVSSNDGKDFVLLLRTAENNAVVKSPTSFLASSSVRGIRVLCQFTTCHLPLRRTKVPLFRNFATCVAVPVFVVPTRRKATTAVSPYC